MTQEKRQEEAGAAASGGGRIAHNAGIFAAGTLTSRITGFVRDAAVVAVFGTALSDIWLLAWTLPNALRRLVGEGSLTVSFVPIFTGRLQEGREEARRFTGRALGAAALLLLLLCVLGIVFMPWIIEVLAGSWEEARKARAVEVGRVAFPYLWFIGLTALFMGALNTLGRFFVPAVCQVFLNLSLIVACLWVMLWGSGGVESGLMALAWAALIGGALQLGANFLALKRAGMTPRPSLALADPHVRRLALLMAPATLAASIHQVNLLVSRAFAASVGPGAITWLYSANVLIELPLGIFAVSIAVASLPALARHAKAGDREAYRATLASSLRQVLYVTLPATAGLAALALPTVAVVFQRGAFGVSDSAATAAALLAYAGGLPAIGCSRIVVQGFYALEDTRTPVLVGVISVLSFVALALFWMPGQGHVGIALAVSVTAWVNLAANLLLLRRKFGRLGLSRVLGSGLRAALGALLTGAAAWGVASLGRWEAGAGALDLLLLRNVGVLLLAVVAGAGTYAGVTLALKSPEARALLGSLRRRLGRA
ncbi:MAG: murein biosynthesis integral membrane protein MurJ [Deltaproteobacteria bacterium]|nr:murein biosynthesis integral membrane protein MurJ [Deltaproteobacteria bacterium]